MPALTPTQTTGRITWLGAVPHRDAPTLDTVEVSEMALDFGGYVGSVHAGLTRKSCSRVKAQYPKGTEIRNTRQISIVSAEELAQIAIKLGVATFDPRWVGATVVVSGIPDFSHIPPSSRLQTDGGTTLTVDLQNRPCQFPAMTIARDLPGAGKGFVSAAKGRRGVTAWVERPGILRIGDAMTLHVPDQRAWLAQPDLFDS